MNAEEMNEDETPVNVYVAETDGTAEDSNAMLLYPGDRWFALRMYGADAVKEAEMEFLSEGPLVFGELHNLPREVGIELLRMVLATLEDGERINYRKDQEEEA